jgi:uncharacterized cofD-like protein
VTRQKKLPKVVVIGGGTGSFTLLSGLKKYPIDLTAIVTMADDGGSTGILRDEYGVLPPGDVRQCLVALSEADETMRKLFTHRYDRGGFKGHAFGNIFLSTLEQVTGSLEEAIESLSAILKVKGRVIPVTLDKISLVARLGNGKVLRGESAVMNYQLVSRYGIESLRLTPSARANPKALRALKDADLIVVGPGKFYSSLLPNFLVEEVGRAFVASRAKKVYVVNLMSQQGHTDDFSVTDYPRTLEKYLPRRGERPVFDTVVYNTTRPPKALLRRYADEGEYVVHRPEIDTPYTMVGKDLLAKGVAKTPRKDLLRRTLIRHDPDKLARAVFDILRHP